MTKKPRKKPTTKGAERLLRNGIQPGNPGNSGGKKGRSGRPPKAFREFCAALAGDPRFQAVLQAAAKDRKSKHFIGAAKLVLAYGEGLPTQPVEMRDMTIEKYLLQRQAARRAQ